jgi:putative membrane protein
MRIGSLRLPGPRPVLPLSAPIDAGALRRCALLATALLALMPRAALAHVGPPPLPDQTWNSWSWDPLVLGSLLLTGWAYSVGVRVLWTRAGVGRGLSRWNVAAFSGGLLTLFVALISPLDGLSAALFSAHMVQHLLLILVAAPLLVAGRPLLALLWALPLRWRRRVSHAERQPTLAAFWRRLSHPAVAWLLAAVALWLWHLPLFYQAALRSNGLHAFEHVCLLATALLFWYVLIGAGGRQRCGYAAAVAYLLAMGAQSSVLGVVLAFSQPWYPAYAPSVAAWHLTLAQDQQIAGLIMWIPAGAIYLIAVLLLIVRWLTAEERAARRREQPRPLRWPADSSTSELGDAR